MVLVEKNNGLPNWTYDDTAWFIGLQSETKPASLDEEYTSVPLSGYKLAYYVAEKIEMNDGVWYRKSNTTADAITFTNTYTYNKTYSGGGGGSYSPSKPVLNKEDHFAFMSGYPDGTFGPGRNITRGEAAAMFARLLTESMELGKVYPNTFSDVPSDLWSANSIGYVQKFGLIAGYGDGTFRPNAPITRAEFAAIACRFENLTKGNAMFKDVPDTHWAANAINFAATRGWVGGYEDGTFRPNAYITRAEVVSVTCRLLERNADASYITENYAKLPHTYSDVNKGHWAFYSVMEASNGHDYTMNNKAETWTNLHK